VHHERRQRPNLHRSSGRVAREYDDQDYWILYITAHVSPTSISCPSPFSSPFPSPVSYRLPLFTPPGTYLKTADTTLLPRYGRPANLSAPIQPASSRRRSILCTHSNTILVTTSMMRTRSMRSISGAERSGIRILAHDSDIQSSIVLGVRSGFVQWRWCFRPFDFVGWEVLYPGYGFADRCRGCVSRLCERGYCCDVGGCGARF
jgi:hypothetical protein